MGFGSLVGSIVLSLVTQYYTPFPCFFVGAAVTSLISIAALSMDDDLETNEFAMKAIEMEEVEL